MKQIIFLLALFAGVAAGAQDTLKNAITAVHDGDTYHLKAATPKGYLTIRPMGFDCPEVRSNHITADQPFGGEITDSVRAWLKGRVVTVEEHGLDKFGRTLAIVKIEGIDIAEIILKSGWAWYRSDKKLSLKTRRKYQRARDYAKKNKLGLWASENPVEPELWRKIHWR